MPPFVHGQEIHLQQIRHSHIYIHTLKILNLKKHETIFHCLSVFPNLSTILMRIEVLTAVVMNATVFQDVMPCSVVRQVSISQTTLLNMWNAVE